MGFRTPGPQDGWSLGINLAHQMFNHMYRVRRGPISLAAQAMMAEPRNRKYLREYLTAYRPNIPLYQRAELHTILSTIPAKSQGMSIKYSRYTGDNFHDWSRIITGMVILRDIESFKSLYHALIRNDVDPWNTTLTILVNHGQHQYTTKIFIPYRRGKFLEFVRFIEPEPYRICQLQPTKRGSQIIVDYIDHNPKFDLSLFINNFSPRLNNDDGLQVIIDRITPHMLSISFAELAGVVSRPMYGNAAWSDFILRSLIDPVRGCVYENMMQLDVRIFISIFNHVQKLSAYTDTETEDYMSCLARYFHHTGKTPNLSHADMIRFVNQPSFLNNVVLHTLQMLYEYIDYLDPEVHYQHLCNMLTYHETLKVFNYKAFFKASKSVIKPRVRHLISLIVDAIKDANLNRQHPRDLLALLFSSKKFGVPDDVFAELMAQVFVGDVECSVDQVMYYTVRHVTDVAYDWDTKDMKLYTLKYAMKRGSHMVYAFMRFMGNTDVVCISYYNKWHAKYGLPSLNQYPK